MNMENKILELIENASNKISNALVETEYKSYTEQIVRDYSIFLITIIEYGLIKDETELDLFKINTVKYFDGNAYASWGYHNLTIQKRFFVERNDEERRNVLFHELIHSLMEKLFTFDNPYFANFGKFLKNIDNLLTKDRINNIRRKFPDIFQSKYYDKNYNVVSESFQTFNEVTTQYLAEILTADSYSKNKQSPKHFQSKIFIENDYFLSDFSIYPEYEQIFLNFLRTINGFGNIESNDDLFYKWFMMLREGTIWNQIISTYKSKGNIELLFEFLISFAALRHAKESSMGIDVVYQGDKEVLTKSLIELDNKLKQNRNLDDECIFDYVEYPDVVEPVEIIRLTPRKK